MLNKTEFKLLSELILIRKKYEEARDDFDFIKDMKNTIKLMEIEDQLDDKYHDLLIRFNTIGDFFAEIEEVQSLLTNIVMDF